MRISLESFDWSSTKPTCEIIDLADPMSRLELFMAFGNGAFEEVRVVGENLEAIDAFRVVMAAGAYEQGDEPPPDAKLWRPGDEMYPKGLSFVFVCPIPDPSLANSFK